MVGRYELAISNATFVEHAHGSLGFDPETLMFEIVKIDDFTDAGLDDGFGAFDAGEVMDIDASAGEFAHVTAEIEDGVELTVTNVRIFGVVVVFGFANAPGHELVGEAIGSAIVSHGKYAIVVTDDASTDLSVGILAAHGSEGSEADKIFIPA